MTTVSQLPDDRPQDEIQPPGRPAEQGRQVADKAAPIRS
jgi:hypothetical protein